MSRLKHPPGNSRPWAGLLLAMVFLQTACATSQTFGPNERFTDPVPGAEAAVYEVDVFEVEGKSLPPLAVDKAAFQRALRGLARALPLDGSPREAAQALLGTGFEEEWLAEVWGGRVLTLVPRHEGAMLVPEADAALKARYLNWCEAHGGGDCLGLLDDGPYLYTDDRRTLALALAFGPVLDETRDALGREVSPRAVVSLVMWTLGLYGLGWVLPEPTVKALAATLTVVLVAWLGVDTVHGLVDGFARMAHAAHEATTFDELRVAGEEYGRVLGQDAARAMVMAVGVVAGRTLGSVAARVRAMPGAAEAGVRWQAQAEIALQEGMSTEVALAAAAETVESVGMSTSGALTVVLLKKGGGRSGAAPGGRGVTVLRHRGGNQQVELADGQRWHLPRGKSLKDIPAQDKVGDLLQQAVTEAAGRWSPAELTPNEQSAIGQALKEGKYWLARLLEREARGRFVQKMVKKQFGHLYEFNLSQGVDVFDASTGLQYEILSGTESNLARHGRRMAGELFRMLRF